ncbi:MAG TPA: DUF4242 domain-containing protein [Vicinamibacteria bacterium]|jgi:hypothetical protein
MCFRSSVLTVLAALAIPAAAWAADAAKAAAPATDPAPAVPAPKAGLKRFMVVRTFAPGALAGLDAAGKKEVNKTNASEKVRWVYSYANADKTKTFCIYEGPDEKAIRQAASANKIPVDYIVEIPVVLTPR